MAKPLTHRHLDIYGDESSQQKRHIVYGTIACETADVPAVTADLDTAVGGYPRELKWHTLSRHDYEVYERFTNTLFDWIRKRQKVRFRSIVVDAQKANYRDYANGDKDLGLQQFIFTLLYTYAQDHAKRAASISVYLDHRETKYPIELQRLCLNRRDKTEHGRANDLFVKMPPNIQSEDYRLVQAADLISGAVAFVTRKDHRAEGAAKHAVDLASLIAWRAQLPVFDKQALHAGIKSGDIETLGLGMERHASVKGVGIWHLDWGKQREIELRNLSKDQLSHFPPELTFAQIKQKGFVVNIACTRCPREH